jgi:hypothetical protein
MPETIEVPVEDLVLLLQAIESIEDVSDREADAIEALRDCLAQR